MIHRVDPLKDMENVFFQIDQKSSFFKNNKEY